MAAREATKYTMTYTIVLTKEQKELIVRALEKFSEYTIGQSFVDQEAAKKLLPRVHKTYPHGTNDLTK